MTRKNTLLWAVGMPLGAILLVLLAEAYLHVRSLIEMCNLVRHCHFHF